jgi:hypothetical protein
MRAMQRPWVPFVVATIVALVLGAVISAAEWGSTAAVAVGAVIGSVLVSVSIPYVLAVRERHRIDASNGHGPSANATSADSYFTELRALDAVGFQPNMGLRALDAVGLKPNTSASHVQTDMTVETPA